MSEITDAIPLASSDGPGATTYWVGGILGGSILSAISASGSFFLEKKAPTLKAAARDFILGAILFLFLLQLLPASTTKLIGYITSFVAVPAVAGLSSVSALVETIPDSIPESLGDIEVKVGVPRF